MILGDNIEGKMRDERIGEYNGDESDWIEGGTSDNILQGLYHRTHFKKVTDKRILVIIKTFLSHCWFMSTIILIVPVFLYNDQSVVKNIDALIVWP